MLRGLSALLRGGVTVAALAAAVGCAAPTNTPPSALTAAPAPAPAALVTTPAPREVKVLILSMFEPEAQPWIEPFQLTETVPVPGLLPDHPALRCNRDGVCLLVLGMGHANAAASTLAVALDARFDLRRTYFLVAGIAGMDPAMGTTGSAAWARWLVEFGIAHEIDAREMPKGWATGYHGVMTKGPGEKPRFDYKTEAFRLDEALLQAALRLSRGVTLADSAEARAYRARYRKAPANQPPTVIQCDTLGGDTWWHGHKLGEHARAWTKLLTDGQGRYCTTQQEDNATYNALARAEAAGRVDLKRLAVLRTGSNFDRPYPGQTAHASLLASHGGAGGSGGFGPATQNLERVGGALVRDIVARWPLWREGVPAP
jgi:purine nucleoside permease